MFARPIGIETGIVVEREGFVFVDLLPVSTPQNAIVYGSGFVPITRMVRAGIVFDVLGALIILLGVPLMVAVVLR